MAEPLFGRVKRLHGELVNIRAEPRQAPRKRNAGSSWAREKKIPETTLRGRLSAGWSIDLALSESVDPHRPRGTRGNRLKGGLEGLEKR
jgi:hypothetical protein